MTRLNTGPQVPKTELRLDWREYFKKFVEAHGEPVEWQGRLLFRDGWGYSSTQYQGPEYPPSEDPANLRTLKTTYWELLRERLDREIRHLTGQIKMLTDWQNARSMPLQQRVSHPSRTELGYLVQILEDPEALDLSGLKANLADREYFRDEAREMLDELVQKETER